MSKKDILLNKLLVTNIDGIPLPLASKLLPFKTRFSFLIGINIHFHAKSQIKNSSRKVPTTNARNSFPKNALLELISQLKRGIKSLSWDPSGTEWFDYYDGNNNYETPSITQKEEIIDSFMGEIKPEITWDLGANTGKFSEVAARHSSNVCAWDIDPGCVELHYKRLASKKTNILPLLMDLSNPSPAIGWNNAERMSYKERGPVDAILALGLIHHLVISNNLPLEKVAEFFSDLTHHLIIEFIPKEDSQVKKLLQNRDDIFTSYTPDHFERIFTKFFNLIEKTPIINSTRVLYFFKNHHPPKKNTAC